MQHQANQELKTQHPSSQVLSSTSFTMDILASSNSVFVCPKELAFALGDSDAAIFLQQIHYWLEHESGKVVDGVRWIYNTYSQWLDEFPHLTEWRLRSIVKLLKSHGVLLVNQLEKKQYKRRCWYTIDYESLEALLGSNREIPTARKQRKSPHETEDSNGSSISAKNSKQENPLKENNTGDVVSCERENFFEDDDEPENSSQTESSHFAEEVQKTSTQRMDSNHEIKDSAGARDNNTLVVLQAYGFELTKQLEKLATKYSEKEVKRSLEYLDECKEGGQSIHRELGWLTECLKNEWWHDCAKSREEQLILDDLASAKLAASQPDKLFAMLWQLVDGGYINEMPQHFDGVIGTYLQVYNGALYVDWHDLSYQQKQDEGIYQTMSITEAIRRFHVEENQ